MSATRRKGSRGGRAAARAGGPPASNALTWAESLAAGEAAPGPSALEWAEGLTEEQSAPSPWGSVPGTPLPAQEAGVPDPVADGAGSPWGHVPTADPVDDDGAADANPWGAVAPTDPAPTRGRSKTKGGKGSKGGKSRTKGKSKSKGKSGTSRTARAGASNAPETGLTPTPAAGFPVVAGPVPDAEPDALPDAGLDAGPDVATASAEEPGDQLPALVPDRSAAEAPDDAWASAPYDGADQASDLAPAQPDVTTRKGRSRATKRIPGTTTAQQKRITTTLRRGLPKVMDKPMVLVLAGVVAAALGLGTGWGTTLLGEGGGPSAADSASCAQTQMAWTQAANAQSAMVEDQPETLRKGFISARDALEGVTPPDAIAKDWAVAFTYYSTVANNVEKVKKNDGPAVSSAVGGAQEQLDTAAMVESFERVQEYVASNCAD